MARWHKKYVPWSRKLSRKRGKFSKRAYKYRNSPYRLYSPRHTMSGKKIKFKRRKAR